MAEREFNNYSTPDHLNGDLEKEQAKKSRRSERIGSPSPAEQMLEAYYADPSKMPDHLGQSGDDLREASIEQVQRGTQSANVEQNFEDYYTARATEGSGGVGTGWEMYQSGDDNPMYEDLPNRNNQVTNEDIPFYLRNPMAEADSRVAVKLPGGRVYEPEAPPVEWTDQKLKNEQWLNDNPDLVKAAVEAGAKPDELNQIVNFDYARQAAIKVVSLQEDAYSAPEGTEAQEQPLRQARALVRNLSPVQRVVVGGMAAEIANERNEFIQFETERRLAETMGAEGPKDGENLEPNENPPGAFVNPIDSPGTALERLWNWSINVDGVLESMPDWAREAVENLPGQINEDGQLRAFPLNNAFTSYIDIANTTYQAGRAGALMGQDVVRDVQDGNYAGALATSSAAIPVVGGIVSELAGEAGGLSFSEAFALANEGVISPSTQREMVAKYGSENWRLLTQLKQWQEEGLDPVAMALTTYGPDDPESVTIVYALTGVVDESAESQEIHEMIRDFDYATNGSLANILYGNEYRGAELNTLRPVIDYSAQMVADPFLIAGAPLRALKVARYSLASLNKAQNAEVDDVIRLVNELDEAEDLTAVAQPTASGDALVQIDPVTMNMRGVSPAVEKLFNKPRVQRAFDVIGARLRKVDEMDDFQKKANAREVLYKVAAKYFPAEMLDEMSRLRVYNAEEAKYWFHDNSVASKVIQGQVATEPPSALMPKANSTASFALDGVRVVRGDTQPLRIASSPETDPFLMVQLGQKAMANPLIPNMNPIGAAMAKASGAVRYGVLDFVTAPQRMALETAFGGREALNQTEPSQVVIFMDMLNKFPELVAAVDGDFQVFFKMNGEDIPITPETAGMVADYLRINSQAFEGSVPKMFLKKGPIGKLYQKMRMLATRGGVEPAKIGRFKNRARGRELKVDGQDTLAGAVLNARHGNIKKRLIVPRFNEDFFGSILQQLWMGAARGVDQFSRIAARYPQRTQLTLDGASGQTVYEFARGWGMSRQMANNLREAWRVATPAQRKQMGGSLAQSALYSRGVPYIFSDPADAQAYMASWGTGTKDGRRYAPTVRNPATGEEYNPAVITDESGQSQNVALHGWQLNDTVQLPNLAAVERVVARKSAIDALLGNNWLWQSFVDWWSLATLLGPRYQLRAGLEDIIFYSFANETNKIGRYVIGQQMDEAVRVARGMKPNTAKQAGLAITGRRAASREEAVENLGLNGDEVAELSELAAARAGKKANRQDTDPRFQELMGRLSPKLQERVTKRIDANNKVSERVRRDVEQAQAKQAETVRGVSAGDSMPEGAASEWLSPEATRLAASLHRWSGLRRFLTTAEQAEVDRAVQALSMGDRTVMAKLMVKAYQRSLLTMMREDKIVQSYLAKRFPNGPVARRLDKKKQEAKAEKDARRKEGLPVLTNEESEVERALGALVRIDNGLTRFDAVSEGADFTSLGLMPPAPGASRGNISNIRTQVVEKRGPVDPATTSGFITKALSKQYVETWGSLIFMNITSGGPLAQSALRNLKAWSNASPKQRAKLQKQIGDVIRNDMGQEYIDQFVMINNVTVDGYAARYMDDMLNTFSRRDGKVNDDLLNLLRDEDGYYNPAQATFDNLHSLAWDAQAKGFRIDNFPKELYDTYGRVTYETASTLNWPGRRYANMGNSLSRLSREPIYMANYILSWRQMQPWRDAQEKIFLNSGVKPKRASEMADELAANTATERAMDLTLSWTDNPSVRSMAAWQVRNISRYWRAQEDLYRRLGRLVRYRPRSVFRMALGYDTLRSSGFTWRDDQGDSYFMYPAADVVINSLVSVLAGLGSSPKIASLPLTYTGRINLLTPSADPGAAFPTGTPGPPTIAWEIGKLIADLNPAGEKALRAIEPLLFGEYGAPDVEKLEFIPYNFKRILDLIMNRADEPGERLNQARNFVAENTVLATRALVAAGRLPDVTEMTPLQRAEVLKEVENVSWWLSVVRTAAGFFEPSRTRVSADRLSSLARDLGVTSWRAEYIKLIDENDGDWNMATVDWLEKFPGLAPFTIGTTEPNTVGMVPFGRLKASDPGVQFIANNPELLDRYPTALPYFAPDGTPTLDAYISAANLDLTAKRPAAPIIDEIFFSKPLREYDTNRGNERQAIAYYDWQLENGEIDAETYDALVDEAKLITDERNEALKKREPGLDSALQRRRGRNAEDSTDEIQNSAVNQFINASRELQEAGRFIPVSPGSDVNKVDASTTVVDNFYQAKAELERLDGEMAAGLYSRTEGRRREKYLLGQFECFIENSFGYGPGV